MEELAQVGQASQFSLPRFAPSLRLAARTARRGLEHRARADGAQGSENDPALCASGAGESFGGSREARVMKRRGRPRGADDPELLVQDETMGRTVHHLMLL